MVSIIISFYKNIPALELIFEALKRQTFRDFEVVVAEDDNATATAECMQKLQPSCFFPIKHVCHEDLGFRKNKILNDAIKVAAGDKLVFLDGDCIPHRKFLAVYNKYMQEGFFYYGRRVWLSQKISDKALGTSNPKVFSLLNLYLTKSRRVSEGWFLPGRPAIKNGRQIWGCNWGVLKKHILDINGFDEDYSFPGSGEDLDIDWRLKKLGLTLVSLKNKAIQYHLYHKMWYNKEMVEVGLRMCDEKQREGGYFCKNGIEKSL